MECQLKGLLIFFDWFLVVANSEGEMANGSSVCNGSCNVCWSEGGNGWCGDFFVQRTNSWIINYIIF